MLCKRYMLTDVSVIFSFSSQLSKESDIRLWRVICFHKRKREKKEHHNGKAVIIKRSESVLAQGSECRLLLGALGEAEQSAKRKAQRCFAPKGVYTISAKLMIYTAEP